MPLLKEPRPRLILLLPLIVPALLGLALTPACSQPGAAPAVAEPPPLEPVVSEPDMVRLTPAAIEAADIRVAAVESLALEQSIETPGRITVDENRTSRVGSFVEGVIVECCVSVGAEVKKGEILARLHSHEVHDAESDYRQALAQLERLKAELHYAQQSHQRASRLYELKAGSLQAVQEAETKLESAERAVDIGTAEIERAGQHLRFLGLNPAQVAGHTDAEEPAAEVSVHERHLISVRAPFSGTVLERRASQGAVVTPSDPLYVISDLSRLWVIAQVPEQHLSFLREGMRVAVTVRAYPGRTFPAGRALKTEMFATIRIGQGKREPSAAVPPAALQHLDGRQVVFVQVAPGAFRVREVETGQRSNRMVQVIRGLEVGESVVTEGSFHVKSEYLKGRMTEE
jgi:cobalt-zinc-cadmium efflux system membrane fusion protein